MKADRTPLDLSPASSDLQGSLDMLRADWLLIAVTVMVAGAVVTLAIAGCVFTRRQRNRTRSFRYRGKNRANLVLLIRSPDQLGEEDNDAVIGHHPYALPSTSDPASYCYVDTDEMMRLAQAMYSVVPHKPRGRDHRVTYDRISADARSTGQLSGDARSTGRSSDVLEGSQVSSPVCDLKDDQDMWRHSVPFDPPPNNVDSLFCTLAVKKCVEVPRHALKLGDMLGSGEFGEVYRALWETPYYVTSVAVKMLKHDATDTEVVKFLQEAAIMGQFRHPHIVRLLGVVTVDQPNLIVLEFLSNGDLRSWLKEKIEALELSQSSGSYTSLPSQLLQFCQQIADGMNYLSNKGFIHRDLAARNILLDKKLQCKIADFGLARDLYGDCYYVASGGNIPVRWSSPEVLLQKRYSTGSDVWSYGMLLFEIWSLGYKPFPFFVDSREAVKKIAREKGFVQPPPPGCPHEIYRLMVMCWNYDHHGRPSFADVYRTLVEVPESKLLEVPLEFLKDLAHPQQAGRLGASLHVAEDMYKELQNYYYQ